MLSYHFLGCLYTIGFNWTWYMRKCYYWFWEGNSLFDFDNNYRLSLDNNFYERGLRKLYGDHYLVYKVSLFCDLRRITQKFKTFF